MALLEIIASSLPDALEAEQGGAHRLELCVDLHVEGLTMPLELISEIRKRVKIPLRVMLRDTPSYTASPAELQHMQQVAKECADLGVDGLVVGFATGHDIDVPLTTELLQATPALKATFQRAFEFAPDWQQGLKRLKAMGQIDRLLTNGYGSNWEERALALEHMRRQADPEIVILAGGGVDAEVIRFLRERTGVKEFHCGRPAREDGVVKAHKVARLVAEVEAR